MSETADNGCVCVIWIRSCRRRRRQIARDRNIVCVTLVYVSAVYIPILSMAQYIVCTYRCIVRFVFVCEAELFSIKLFAPLAWMHTQPTCAYPYTQTHEVQVFINAAYLQIVEAFLFLPPIRKRIQYFYFFFDFQTFDRDSNSSQMNEKEHFISKDSRAEREIYREKIVSLLRWNEIM